MYKQIVDEANDFKAKINELETENQKYSLSIKNLEHELNEADKYKSAYDFMKEELLKTKETFHVNQLELEKTRSMV